MSNDENYLTAFIHNRNKTISEYVVQATKKFIVNDETYVIKDNCTYKKVIDKKLKLVAYYSEGNPNPYNLKKLLPNKGLSPKELDGLIAGDIFNILIECQNTGKQGYVLGIAFFVLFLNIFGLITNFI